MARPNPDTEPPALRDLIRKNMRRIRQDRNMSRSEVAHSAQAAGFDWTDRTVTKIETGDPPRRLSLEEFHALPLIFEGTGISDFYKGADTVKLNDTQTSRVDALTALLAGDEDIPRSQLLSVDIDAEAMRRGVGQINRFLAHLKALGYDASWVTIRKEQQGATESALANVARRLGQPEPFVNAAALARYGRTLTEERDRRVRENMSPPGESDLSLPRKRGAATREITKELRSVFHGFD